MPRTRSRVAEVDQVEEMVSEEEAVSVEPRGASIARSSRSRRPKVEARSRAKDTHPGVPTGKKRRTASNGPAKFKTCAHISKGLVLICVLLVAITLSIAALATLERDTRHTNDKTSHARSADKKKPPTATNWWFEWRRGSLITLLVDWKQRHNHQPNYVKAVRCEPSTNQKPEYCICPPCPACANRHVRYVCPSCKKVNSDSPELLKDSVSVLSDPQISQLPAPHSLLQGLLNAEHRLLTRRPWVFLVVTGLASILPLVFISSILSAGIRRLIELWKMRHEENSVLVQSAADLEGEREKSRREAEQELLASMKINENVENVPQVGKYLE